MPRKVLDGPKLAADVTQLFEADKQSPPVARPSLMDAVRALVGFIEARGKLGWTDTMIATVLTEAGYPIGPATLRSYRKRLRDKSDAAQRGSATVEGALPSPVTCQSGPAVPVTESNAAETPVPALTQTGAPQSGPSSAQPRQDPPLRPRRTFAVDRSNLPPDRA